MGALQQLQRAVRDLLVHPVTVRGAQLAIGVIFLWAGLAKLGDPIAFAREIHNFRMIPVPTENLLAITLPWIELTTALALLLGIERRAGAVSAAFMMVVFTVAVGQAVTRGLDIECGCFGTADASSVGVKKLVENLGMLAIAVVASLRAR